MSEGFECRRHHVEYWPFFAAKYLLRNFERGLRRLARQIEHFCFSITVMLDQLIRAMTMVVIDAAMRGQYQLDVELLHLQLRRDEIAERVGSRRVRIDPDMWRNFGQQVIADDHHLFLA